MNIGQLKAELARYPDHWEVLIEQEQFNEQGESDAYCDCPVDRVRNEANHIVLEFE